MSHHSNFNSTGWIPSFQPTKRVGLYCTLAMSAFLTACGGGESPAEVGPSPDGVLDGTPPTIVSMSAFNEGNGSDAIEPGETLVVAFQASESIMKPTVLIDGAAATVSGQHNSWEASAKLTGDATGGLISISVSMTDNSGEVAATDTAGPRGKDDDGVDHPPAYFCDEGCSVGPKGTQQLLDFRVDDATHTFFDFGPDHTAATVVADPTDATNMVLMSKKLAAANDWGGTWIMTDSDHWNSYGTYKLKGKDGNPDGVMSMNFLAPAGTAGAKVRLKLENSADGSVFVEADATIASPGEWETLIYDFNLAADYDVEKVYDKLVVFFDYGNVGTGADQTFYVDDIRHGGIPSNSTPPWVGLWQVAAEAGSMSVGPAQGSAEWWSTGAADIDPTTGRTCFWDDMFYMGIDGTFRNIMGDATWIESTDPAGCAAPVAPWDGTSLATYVYDEENSTITVVGEGAHLGLSKVTNQGETGQATDNTIVYTVSQLAGDGSSMVVDIEAGTGVWWRFKLEKFVTPLAGAWKLAPEAAAMSVGPSQGSTEWWSNGEADVDTRGCLFNDTFYLGADLSFANIQGSNTWLEGWQGVASDQCGAPVAPHDGSGNHKHVANSGYTGATYSYDATAGTLTVVGAGAHMGLPKATNQNETGQATDNTRVYTVSSVAADGTAMTLDIEAGTGVWWRFKLVKADTAVAGKWKLKPVAGALSSGPSAGSSEWWSNSEADIETRACLFDDIFNLSHSTAFSNHPGEQTWLETWQGAAEESCGTPVAPHDGSGSNFQWHYDLASKQLVLEGQGAHVGLPEVVNDCQLGNSADGCTTTAPDSVTYTVKSLNADKTEMELHIEAGKESDVWWKFILEKE